MFAASGVVIMGALRRRVARGVVIIVAATVIFCLTASTSVADHESANLLIFAPVAGSTAPGASGGGTLEFRGGGEPQSRWTMSLRFAGLGARTTYTVLVQGRFGADRTPEAGIFTPLCSFQTNERGEGRCWNYFLGLKHASIFQVREGQVREDADGGPVVAQASRSGGPGAVTSQPNRFTPR